MAQNPYSSPSPNGWSPFRAQPRWLRFAVLCSFWSGVIWFGLGSIVTFAPGASGQWYLLTGLLLAPSLTIPDRRYQIAAVLFIVFCALFAWDGYWQGVAAGAPNT